MHVCLPLLTLLSLALSLTHALPAPPPSPKTNATVLILGGGVAGVTAARTLSQLSPSTSFLVIEARGELGGRLQSHTMGSYTVERGANWVHGTQTRDFERVNPIWEMVKRWGVRTMYSDYYGSMTTYDETGPAPFLPLLNASLAAYAALVTHACPPASSTSSECTSDSSARDGYESLGFHPETPAEKAVEYYTFDWEYADRPEKTSWWASGLSNNHTYEPSAGGFSPTNHLSVDPRGFKHFILAEAQSFLDPAQVRLNSMVKEIRLKDERVEVVLESGEVLTGEYALCTFSLGVLQAGDVRWDERLIPHGGWKEKALAGMDMATFTKIFLQFEEKFWFDTEFALYAGQERGYYPVWQSLDHPKLYPGSGILFVTVTGDFARRVDAMSEKDVKREVLEVLGRMYPNVTIPEPIAFHIPHWLSDPLFRGSYSNWPATFTRSQHAALRAKVGGKKGKVWFAGEHTSEQWFGFLHGAYYEGLAVSEEMVRCIRGWEGCIDVRYFAEVL
ncbi:amine oxidase [Gloeophyllum trabeum ATCC 11539]|uniref:Amine oxidase n=1 Tax=Gloeophyllum trabeum (strain ATCC 11539 / FP-39264 / Madison 617) TaxID=670483 RepID=S7R7Y0_GLOTA|nr:amine oxidase [Gloeophyllum trabeum ATCC 11539]EPQ50455.1 amine oxidase [Gloeophyllum trabeum ATCC 11539]